MITFYSLKNILRSLVESREVTWKGDLSFKTTNLASVRAKAKPQFSTGVACRCTDKPKNSVEERTSEQNLLEKQNR